MQKATPVVPVDIETDPVTVLVDDDVTGSWLHFADVLLARAVQRSSQRTRAGDPLAGLRIADEDVAALLQELSADFDNDADDVVADARQKLHDVLVPGDPLADIASTARLSGVETEVLAVLAALELDARRARLVAYLNDDVTQRRVTIATLTRLFPGEDGAVLAAAPGGGLRRAALLDGAHDERCWAETPLALAHTVLWWLAGDVTPDPALPAGFELVEVARSGGADLVVTSGADRVRRLQAAIDTLSADGFVVTPLPATAQEWDAVIRYATLAGLGVVLDIGDELPAQARDRVERADHLPWAIASEAELPLITLPRRPWVAAATAPAAATAEETAAILGADPPVGARLTAAQLDAVAPAVSALGGDVAAAVRRLAAGKIAKLADRITPTRGWDDLILPDRQLEQVRHVAVRARHRRLVYGEWGFDPRPSTGVVAIFSGPSGTGKTLAAEIVAGDLGLDLYRVDLSRLVDKYIGETEKNLSEAFAAAEASPVVLFFDEADAVMGKRSEVSDAHDRYANIEVAYLLQRIERFEGVVIMASNLAKNLDPAFMRRIHVALEFPMPGPEERRAIWARSIPPAAPIADLDLDYLATRFEMSGGSIHNAAATAAFLAAEAGTPLTMAAATGAVRRELHKQGRLVRPEDFKPWDPAYDESDDA